MPEEVASKSEQSIDLLLDIPLNITVELGRTRLRIQELLDLGQGSVVELDRIAGEPADIMVNGRRVAHGEIVVLNDRYAVRVVAITSPTERAESLA